MPPVVADRLAASAIRGPRIRLLHLVISLDMGGLERVVVNHARLADRSRFDVEIVCLGQEGRLAAELRNLGVSVEALGVHGPQVARALQQLVRVLRRRRPHVLHTHDFAPHLLGSPAAFFARVPVVIHTRHCLTGGLTLRQAVGMRIASALSSEVVAVSEESGRLLEAEGVPPSKRSVIHNGVDVAAFPVGDRWTRPPGRRVISVGRLAQVKDYPTLLRAARLVVAALPDFRLDIVGDGPERSSLEGLRTELGLESCVRFMGERYDVAALLASADVFALASTTEGLSISILEALAAGLPIIATRVGGNAEIVTNGVHGVLVPPGDADALAAELVALLSAPKRLMAMGRSARLRAEEHFDLPSVVARYEALYLERLSAAGIPVPAPARGD